MSYNGNRSDYELSISWKRKMSGQVVEGTALELERQALHSRLQAENRRIQSEISRYPTPIAGCDQQFNYLLERRTQIQCELARLAEAEQAHFRR